MRYPSVAPKHWTRSIQTALVHVMSLAHYALVHTRSWAANGSNDRARLSAKSDQLDHEIRLLREERIPTSEVASTKSIAGSLLAHLKRRHLPDVIKECYRRPHAVSPLQMARSDCGVGVRERGLRLGHARRHQGRRPGLLLRQTINEVIRAALVSPIGSARVDKDDLHTHCLQFLF